MIVKFITFVRWIFASETLPMEVVLDDVRGIRAPKRGLARWVLKSDTLGTTLREGVAVARRQRFLRRVFAAETLAISATEPKEAPEHCGGFWSWLVGPEVLSDTDDDPNPLEARTMFFRRLIAPEACPEQRDVEVARRVGVVRHLLRPERCPSRPVRAPGRQERWFRRVLEAEDCPVEPSPSSLRRRGFLRNLLTPEEL